MAEHRRQPGKVIVALGNTGEMRSLYTQNRPSLEGRPVFTSATPGDPVTAPPTCSDDQLAE